MDLSKPFHTTSPQETQKLGEAFAQYLVSLKKEGAFSNILCLNGELGSGKTTFIQGFARGLGITSRLLSPTFIIVRRYDLLPFHSFFYHIDLYRLITIDNVATIGLYEILSNPENFIAIEWAEKLGKNIPKRRINIQCTVTPNGDHTIEFRA